MTPFPFIKLTGSRAVIDLDVKEHTLEWLIVSNQITDFAASIAAWGMVQPDMSLIVNGEPMGWYPPGTPYRIGNDHNDTCYAGMIEVYDREIIGGKGDYEIDGVVIRRIYNTAPLIKWRVRQQYSTSYDKACGIFPSEEDKVTVSLSYEWEERPLEHDIIDGRMVVNSAGMHFNPPSLRRRKIPVYSMTRREIVNPLHKAQIFTNTVNNAEYHGAPPYTLLMDSITTSFDGQIWRVTYNIKERYEGWQTYLLDTGYYERLPNGLLMPILDDVNTPLSEPAKLNGQGRRLMNQEEPGVNVGPFHKYPAANFDELALPNPFALHSIADQYA